MALSQSIETMGTGVFYGCSALTDVRLNENLKTIGNDTLGQDLQHLQLRALCQPETAAGKYTWASSKAASVDVDEKGCVTVVGGTGTVIVTCTAADGSGKKATVKIKVG